MQNRQAALRKRSRGSAAPLKNSNNYIQRLLLQEFAAGRERLLDLSCGPGRDLRKWIHCDRLQYVRAYSHSEEQVCKTDLFPGRLVSAAVGICSVETSRLVDLETFCPNAGWFRHSAGLKFLLASHSGET